MQWRRAMRLCAFGGGLAVGAIAVAGEAPPNLLSFAQGTLPLAVEADAAARVRTEHAIRAIDGSTRVYALTAPVPPSTTVAFVYALAAPTVFERFSVPGVRETPSPSQTFVREVKVFGSPSTSGTEFVLLASGTLAAGARPDDAIELAVHRRDRVRRVRVELSGALDPARPALTLEFSEIVGEGRQEDVPTRSGFAGVWQGRGVALALSQDGAVVAGCYDRTGMLEGTVSGNVLFASGRTSDSGVGSAFVAALVGDELVTLRSTNGAPFVLGTALRGGPARVAACAQPGKPALGCGSVVHGIRFEFDSAVVRPESAPVLDALRAGLAGAKGSVHVEGHTSSEGDDAYNRALSERRAQAVVDELVRRGIARAGITASGAGENRPIAPNDDATGRALNRRVEVRCG